MTIISKQFDLVTSEGASPRSMTITSPASGNALVCFLIRGALSGEITGVTDNQGNTYTLDKNFGTNDFKIYRCNNITNAPTSLSISLDGNNSVWGYLFEIDNLADSPVGQTPNIVTASSVNTISTSITTTTNREILLSLTDLRIGSTPENRRVDYNTGGGKQSQEPAQGQMDNIHMFGSVAHLNAAGSKTIGSDWDGAADATASYYAITYKTNTTTKPQNDIISEATEWATISGITDTVFAESAPTNSYDTTLSAIHNTLSSTNRVVSYYKFTGLSSIPTTSTVTAAYFLLANAYTHGDPETFDINAHKVLKNVSASTWNQYSSGNNWTTAGGLHSSDQDSAFYTKTGMAFAGTVDPIDNSNFVTLVNSWVQTPSTNYGMLLRMDNVSASPGSDFEVHSSSATNYYGRPYLLITYTPGGVIMTRPTSDITDTGWVNSTGTDSFALIDESTYSDADYITSPTLGTGAPITMGISPTLGAGTYTIRVRGKYSLTSGQIKVSLLDSGNSVLGASSWQALTSSNATYSLIVTTSSGTADRIKIEVQA